MSPWRHAPLAGLGCLRVVGLVMCLVAGAAQASTVCAQRPVAERRDCEQRCSAVPVSPECLVTARFGPAGLRALAAVRAGTLPTQAAAALGANASDFVQMLELDRLAFRSFGTEALPKGDQATLLALHNANLALFALVAQGKLGEALSETNRILAARQALLGPKHPLVAESLNNRGFLLDALGGHREALVDLTEALALRTRALGASDALVGNTLNNLCTVYTHLGRLDDAVRAGHAALAIYERVMGLSHPSTAAVRNNLGTAYLRQGALDAARVEFEAVAAILAVTRGSGDPWTLTVRGNLAAVQDELGDRDGAERLYRAVLADGKAALGDTHPLHVITLSNLAVALMNGGAAADAVVVLREALARQRGAHGDGQPDELPILQNLATALAAAGKTREAQETQEGALARAVAIYGESHPTTATILNNLGALRLTQGGEGGVSLLERALGVRRALLGEWHPEVASTLGNLVMARWHSGDRAGARALQPRVLEILRDHFQRNLDGADSDLAVLAFLASVRAPFDVSLSLFDEAGDAPHSFGDALIWQGAGALAEAVWHDTRRVVEAGGREAQTLWSELRELERERLRLTMAPAPGAERDAAQARLQREADSLRERLRLRVPELSRSMGLGATPAQVCERLRAANATLLDVVRYERAAPALRPGQASGQYDAFVMAPSEGTASEPCRLTRLNLGEAHSIDAQIETWRARVEAAARCEGAACGPATLALEKASAALHAAVLGPLVAQRRLPEDGRLFYVPDGRLVEVPLAALFDGARYVVERLAVTTLPYPAAAAAVARETSAAPGGPRARTQGGGRASKGALVVGDLDYDAAPDSGGVWLACGPDGCGDPAGPAAETPTLASRSAGVCGLDATWGSLVPTEAAAVALALGQSLPGVTLVTGATASEARLRAELPGHRVLHLATHGFFSSAAECAKHPAGDPLRLSAVVLSGANTTRGKGTAEDGLLAARDIAAASLSGTELVVLSACESGRGTAQVGEGVLGLARSFGVAGAASTIASLWEVPNVETSRLFELFYVAWLAGADVAGALQQAQRALLAELRQDAPETRGSAALWGAFVAVRYAAPGL